VVIAPVVVDSMIVMASGTEFAGIITDVKSAADAQRAQLRFTFNPLSAIVTSLDHARETVTADGLIMGIDVGKTYSSRLGEGIDKLQSSDRFSGLAGLIQGAKQKLKIDDANPNIGFDPGVEIHRPSDAAARLARPAERPRVRAAPVPQ